jgi:hypothetical protein
MGDEIPAALTAAEWAARMVVGAGAVDSGPNGNEAAWIDAEDGTLVLGYDGNFGEGRPTRVPALIALANAALPDGHPNKITHATALAMTQAAWFIEGTREGLSTEWPDDANPWHMLAQQLRQEAAKLAALLPPEWPDPPK